MNEHELNLIREAVTQTRYEAGLKAAPPGPDAFRMGANKVTKSEVREIRDYVRASLKGDAKGMRKFGTGSE
jgi:hypothetical protein